MAYELINSTKTDGNTSIKYDDKNVALENRKKFFQSQNICEKNTVLINVKYSDKIVELDECFLNQNKNLDQIKVSTDCVITNLKGIFIYLLFGDCIPFVIYDAKKDILAFAHLGWQSIELKLHSKIVNTFLSKYNSKTEDLYVELGPSIKKESYILKNPSQLRFNEWEPYLNNIGNDNYEIDLNGFVIDDLKKLGIKNIKNSPIDTGSDKNYFSHYRCTYIDKTEKEGRFICGAQIIKRGKNI